MAGKSHEFRQKRPGLVCDYCGYKGDLKQSCYKIARYPPNFKSKKKDQNTGGRTYVNNATTSEMKQEVMMPTQGNFFAEEHYKQLVNLLQKTNTSDCSTNTACIIVLMVNVVANDHVWIVDSGATHHVTHCKNALSNLKRADNRTDVVQLPTGNKADITHTEDAVVLGDKSIEGVLYVPDFKFNILLVSKLTKQLCCSVGFYPDFCILSGALQWQGVGIGRENNRLYLIKENLPVTTTSFLKGYGDTKLWHLRLGHASAKSMEHISALNNKIHTGVQDNCEVFPLANNLPKGDKFTVRARKVVLIGYSETQKGYRLYDLENMSIFVSRDVMFKEEIFPFRNNTCPDDAEDLFTSPNSLEAAEMQQSHPTVLPFTYQNMQPQIEDTTNTTVGETTNDARGLDNVILDGEHENVAQVNDNSIDGQAVEPTEAQQHSSEPTESEQEVKPTEAQEHSLELTENGNVHPQQTSTHMGTRKSGRQGKPSIWLKDYSYLSIFSVLTEPQSFKEAVHDPRRIEAMNQEIKALEDNHTYEVVDLPEGEKPIGSK
ncbi:uncharacterized protein LOC142166996 [Nicotiana tabacum]|uniref:Uncharacterized protein LOC142166996 n=1 Tax=Nicotiana tabacum TaxID=4097 RepID=A0AC58SE52_TOBAC